MAKYEKQKLLLEYAISSPDVFGKCAGILLPKYFDATLRKTVKFVQNYYNQYNSLPSIDQIKVETEVTLKTHKITRDLINYCADEIEKFCRRRAILYALNDSADIVMDKEDNEEEFVIVEKMIKDALMVSLNRELGINFFDDSVLDRIEERKKSEQKLPTNYTDFDDYLKGGPSKKELIIFAAESGGGKSLMLQNFGMNYVLNGKHVLYLSLELYQTQIDERFVEMFTGMDNIHQRAKKDETAEIIHTIREKGVGSLFIKYFSIGFKTNDIKAYLKEYELLNGYLPDVICVDYLDLLTPAMPVSPENAFLKDKYSSEELRAIAVEYDLLILTASQLNREAREAKDYGQHHISGGISKVNTADVVATIDFNSPVRKQENTAIIKFIKTRSSDGVGKALTLKFNPQFLRFENGDKTHQQAPSKIKEKILKREKEKRKNILDDDDFFDVVDIGPGD